MQSNGITVLGAQQRCPTSTELTGDTVQHSLRLSCDGDGTKTKVSSLKWAISSVQHTVCFSTVKCLFDYRYKQQHKPEPIGCRLVWIMALLKEWLCSIRFLLPNLFYLTREWKDAFVCFPIGGDRKLERHKWTWKKEQSAKITIGMLEIWYVCWVIKISKRVLL